MIPRFHPENGLNLKTFAFPVWGDFGLFFQGRAAVFAVSFREVVYNLLRHHVGKPIILGTMFVSGRVKKHMPKKTCKILPF